MTGDARYAAAASQVEDAVRLLGLGSMVGSFVKPSLVAARYESYRATKRATWEALAARGVVPIALAGGDGSRAFRTRCPGCKGRGTVPSYSEHYGAYVVSRGRQLRDPCAICRRDRRHYSPGWVENDFPMSAEAMVAVSLLGPHLFEIETSAREVGRLVTGVAPASVVWRIDTLGRWPKDARRAMLRAMRRTGMEPQSSSKTRRSRSMARSLDAAACVGWALTYGDQAPPCPLVTVAEMQSLGADLIDVDEHAATVFVAIDDPARASLGWCD